MSARNRRSRGDSSPQPAGPLVVCADNPIWPVDGDGRAVFLSGSHTWSVFQQRGVEGVTPDFDFNEYLDMMAACGHNYLRLWVWEHCLGAQFAPAKTPLRYKPLPWVRSGEGRAADGGPKFDLGKFNPEFFKLLHRRVTAAGRRGIFVSVMLFQGFSLYKQPENSGTYSEHYGNAWDGHPFNIANNINGIDGDGDGSGTGHLVHTLADPAVTRLQEAYIRQMVDTLADYDYVFWEVANESECQSVAFQRHVINYLRDYIDCTGGGRRLIGMTGSPIDSETLFASSADWVSPPGAKYLSDPAESDGSKIVIIDTDHCDYNCTDPLSVWRAFLRGNSFCAMDPWRDFRVNSPRRPVEKWDDLRRAMGAAVAVSQRLALRNMRPASQLCSSGYCLTDGDSDWLLLRESGNAPLTLAAQLAAGKYCLEWIDCVSGRVIKREYLQINADSGSPLKLTSGCDGPVVALLRKMS